MFTIIKFSLSSTVSNPRIPHPKFPGTTKSKQCVVVHSRLRTFSSTPVHTFARRPASPLDRKKKSLLIRDPRQWEIPFAAFDTSQTSAKQTTPDHGCSRTNSSAAPGKSSCSQQCSRSAVRQIRFNPSSDQASRHNRCSRREYDSTRAKIIVVSGSIGIHSSFLQQYIDIQHRSRG